MLVQVSQVSSLVKAQVQSLFNFFKGLLNDFDGASAAYSLRRLGSYNSSVLRIRRASDNVEVNVAFNSANAVGANSPISNVVNTVLANETSFPSGTGAFLSSTSGTAYLNGNFEGKNNVLSAGFDGSGLFGLTLNHTYGIGERLKVRYELYYDTQLNTGGAPLLTIRNSHSLIGSTSLRAPTDQWFIFEDEFVTTASGTNLTLHLSSQNPSVQAGDVFLVANASIEKLDDPADTTATTLGAFLNEPIPTFTADFSSGVNGFVSYSSGTLAGNEDGIDGEDNNLSSTQSGTGQVVYGVNGRTTIGKKYKVSFKYYVPSGSGSYTQISIRDGAHIIIGSDESPTTNNWISVEATAVFTTPQIRFQFVGTSVAGEKIYIRDVVVSEIGEATVHTWYDQSGDANDATQDTSGEQPKIAEAGIIKTQGGKPCLDFDGTNHRLDIDGYAPISLVYSSFVVASLEEPNAASIRTIFDSTDNQNGGFAIVHGNTANKFTPFWFDGDGTSPNVFGSGSNLTSTKALYSTIIKTGASTVHIDGTLDQTFTNTWTLSGSNNFSKSTIGYDQTTPNREFDGKIQEIIIYESDQSENRFKIESNINNYYGIYTVANDGFVRTWYDQSGNSNDASQPSKFNQPKIVNSGSLTTQGGKPCLDFDGVDDVLQFSAPDVQSGNIRSVFVACSAPTSQNKSVMGTDSEFLIKRDSSRAISQNNFGASRLDSAFTFSGTITHLVTVIRNYTASSSSLSLDGDVDDTRTDSYGLNSVHQIGGKKSGSNIIEEADFNCLEIIVYASDQTTNRASIESNIADEYGINIS